MNSAEPRKKRVEGGGTGTGSGRWSASSLNVTAVQVGSLALKNILSHLKVNCLARWGVVEWIEHSHLKL